jgi:hypothetical protein
MRKNDHTTVHTTSIYEVSVAWDIIFGNIAKETTLDY